MMLSSASEYSATLPVNRQARNLSPSTSTPMPMLPRASRYSVVCEAGMSGPVGIGLAAKAISILYRNRIARAVGAGSAGRQVGVGSARGVAEFLAQPVVDQALLVAQLVAVGQRRAALQVGDVGQLARALREHVSVGADELEVQGD